MLSGTSSSDRSDLVFTSVSNPRDQKPFLSVLRGFKQERPALWMMRQAGRYLPEYRVLREKKGGFLKLCYDPQTASEVTLQPVHRFGFDCAILFSDILIVPHAMGQDLWFEEGEGPRLSPRLVDHRLSALGVAAHRYAPVIETVRRVKAMLSSQTGFLGFAGSPWTVATYMIMGRGSRDQAVARRFAYSDAQAMQAIIDAVVTMTIDYLCAQIEAGVEAVQLFDSWAGNLSPRLFERWVIAPNAAIVSAVRERFPGALFIGFPKGAGEKLPAYVRETGVDAIGIDETFDPFQANAFLPVGFPVQGNLDPLALVAGGVELDAAINDILAAFSDRPHIFNLGHGIVPDTPIAHVEHLVKRVRND